MSKVFNIPVPEKPNSGKPDEGSADLKAQKYKAGVTGTRNEPDLKKAATEDK